MTPAPLPLAIGLLWVSALCSAMAGAAVLVRWRAPLALPAGALLLTVSAKLVVLRLAQIDTPLALEAIGLPVQSVLHGLLLVVWLALVLDLTREIAWRRITWWGAALVSFALSTGIALASPAVQATARATMVPGTWPTPAWLIALSVGIGVFTGARLTTTVARPGPRRLLAAAALASLVLAGLAGILERIGYTPLAPMSLVQWFYAAMGLIAALAVVRGQPGRAISTAQTVVYEHIRDGVIVLDPHDIIVSLNTAAREILSFGARTAVGQPLPTMWPESSALLAELRSKGNQEVERIITRDGVSLTYAIAVLPTENLSGTGHGRAVVLRDITGREGLEQALRRRAEGLSRTNQLVTALATVTARLGNTTDPRQVWELLGGELGRLGLSCGIASIDPAAEAATIRYVSLNSTVLNAIRRLAHLDLVNATIPRSRWPGDRVLLSRAPTWHPDPQAYIRRLFPHIPLRVTEQLLQLAGIGSDGQVCVLPLVVGERVIGAMLIWGADLRPDDSPVLEIFAGQVAGILSSADAHAQEINRASDLERSNGMILALSNVAARLDSTSKFDEVIDTFGRELHTMGVECLVGTFDDIKQNMRVQYTSVNRDIIQWAERVTGFSLSYLVVPRRLWPSDRVVTERAPFWDPQGMRGTLNIFPVLSEGIHRAALKLAGFNLDDPVCYLPLAHDEDVIGILAVWGASLQASDVPALSVFSTQLATALRNTELFENETRRTRELSLLLEASEATAASSDLEQVLSILAAQLLEISGFEACQISEWDRGANRVSARHHRSRILWDRERRACRSLATDPDTRLALETGTPSILAAGTDARRRVRIRLPLRSGGTSIGLAELILPDGAASPSPTLLAPCLDILDAAASWITEPIATNPPDRLLHLQDSLLHAAGAAECELLQWEASADRLWVVSTGSDAAWDAGVGPSREPGAGDAVALALTQGEASVQVQPYPLDAASQSGGGSAPGDALSWVVFPLQVGTDRIGVVELHDYNHERTITPAQVAFLRTVADKAGYSIHNARLLEETQRRLGEKEVLLKEVHHRVKNNLQVISSLLSLQSAQIADARVKDALRESQNRVRSMALIHEKLYQSSDLAQVDFAAYLRSLVNFLAQSYRQQADHVSLGVFATDLHLDLETAIPCGLIVNELVSNALKHAFPDGRPGVIEISILPLEPGRLCLKVKDDGVGFPDGASEAPRNSLGLSLVHTLTDQLGGSIEVNTGVGVEFVICFRSTSSRPRT